MAKPRRGRVKGSKNRKAPEWAQQYGAASRFADCGVYEQWARKIGVERIDEANTVRRETFAMLKMQDREVDAGGRVISQGAKDEFEHAALDPLRRAGILDDPREPQRARWRLEAGVELLRLYVEGRVQSRCTAAWKAIGGGGGGGVSEAEAEGRAARDEMRYYRAVESVGLADKEMIRQVCIAMTVPSGTKRSRLNNALDLLAEYLFDTQPPQDVIRPKVTRRQID